jgi:transposase
MAFDKNLEEIRSRGLHYIVASRQPERNRWLAEFEEDEDFKDVTRAPSPRNPFQEKSHIRVKSKKCGENETHVLCVSSGRVQKDRAIREKHEQRLLRDLERLDRRIRTGKLVDPERIAQAVGRLKERHSRVARYYRMDYDETAKTFRYERDEEKRARAEKLDGCYLLKTDRTDLSADDVWRTYSLLTRAEAAFRAMKSPLAERPIHHQVERRVDTHIFLCVLAYHLLVAIEKTLLDQNVHTSWATVRETLQTHQVATVVLPTPSGAVLRLRKATNPEKEQERIYQLLRVPTQIIRPRKTWSDSTNRNL